MYLDKQFLLHVYKHLSTMHADPALQGARQKVSAIKYFLASDAFMKSHADKCDTKNKEEDAAIFIQNVGNVVKVNDSEYTRDFYAPLLHNSQDYDVGSNFYSAGVVNLSKNNRTTIYEYPQRGSSPIMQIQNGIITLANRHYNTFSNKYLPSPSIAACLALWLCRFDNFIDQNVKVLDKCLDRLSHRYTASCIEMLKEAIGESEITWLEAIIGCHLQPSMTYETITGEDINGLWNLPLNVSEAISAEKTQIQTIATTLRDTRAKRNKIYFGAPGTGKSHKLSQDASKLPSGNLERVTFYPTYSYAQFVGAYKPTVKTIEEPEKNPNDIITYGYVPGPFLRLLAKAINSPNEDFLIIIEELNRANAAAVFGDLFQLLDRKDNGASEYPIALSEDLKRFFLDNEIELDTLVLPFNLYVWATMNSADQGVFPLDTAFKRRWDFEYLGINHNEDVIQNYEFDFTDGRFNWNSIRHAVNDKMLEGGVNEDKLLGPFFVKPETLATQASFMEAFKAKVLMYLFEDAVRHNPRLLFKGERKEMAYSKLCDKLDHDGLKAVLDIEVSPLTGKTADNQPSETEQNA